MLLLSEIRPSLLIQAKEGRERSHATSYSMSISFREEGKANEEKGASGKK
jgi:hypothetical protein